jgi:queuine tRNA-ribosyltransferase
MFDCAVPTRLARHGMALAPLPAGRFRYDLRRAAFAEDAAPLVEGCPCEACSAHSRAYLHYLCRAEELTAVRLLVAHNLTFVEHLVRGARRAIVAGHLDAYRREILDGMAPWSATPAAA